LRVDQRVVTKIPLTELWNDTGTIVGDRIRHLDDNSLSELIRTSSVRFVVADCGLKLDWIPAEKRFDNGSTSGIADPVKPIFLKNFPHKTAFIASEWRGPAGECLILLERYH
jgi:hypothetical protein